MLISKRVFENEKERIIDIMKGEGEKHNLHVSL